ncbi:Hypothetical protein SAMN05444678_102222 [Sphingomonas sp. YR710]|uniref:DUF2513 domain-containing protein n=1 Tax=Sphingomonas sp. YR710 TaxID=1882773 RepID=UPI00088D1366|nr:DUF2513 domain-containing protein [Sphingomonas sp. YR710]SDC29523.1 Hypothetical protein SAMN05444678_102222 [Sphingomonas sp. YR710]
MKRDIGLLREILLWVDDIPTTPVLMRDCEINGFSAAEISYHAELMIEGGLLIGTAERAASGDEDIRVEGLTMRAHDFLTAVRNPKVWLAAKEAIDACGGVPFDVALEVAKGFRRKSASRLTDASRGLKGSVTSKGS